MVSVVSATFWHRPARLLKNGFIAGTSYEFFETFQNSYSMEYLSVAIENGF